MTSTPDRTYEPLVSAIITTYNRPEYLRRAVRAVSNQTYQNIELVVVDDCSETPARNVLADASPDVRTLEIIRHEENLGANAARNTGVEIASGEYVAFLDDDDRWDPEKLARQVDALERADENVGLAYVGRVGVEDGTSQDTWIPPEIEGDLTKALLCRNVVGTQSAVMVRTDIAETIPFDERFRRWADMEWYVSVSIEYDFIRIPAPLVVYEYAAHNRISDDSEELYEAHRLFVKKYRELAAEYGRLFERKMRAWAAYRVGASLVRAGNYANARQYLLQAIVLYPFERSFYKYGAAALGGPVTHQALRRVKALFDPGPSADG